MPSTRETTAADVEAGGMPVASPATGTTAASATVPALSVPRRVLDPITWLLGEPAARTEHGRRRAFRWGLVVLLLACFTAPGWAWLDYRSQRVVSRNAAVRGHVADLGARLNGVVTAVLVDTGDRVEAGQPLVQFASDYLEARVAEARAEVGGLERSIEVEQASLEIEAGQLERKRSDSAAIAASVAAQVDTARVGVEDARAGHELQHALFEGSGVVSDKAVRDAEFRLRAAESRLREAMANAIVSAQTTGEQIRGIEDSLAIRRRKLPVLEANLAGARARLCRAEADLDSATVRAPAAGAIVRRIVQPGGSVEVGLPVISMWLGSEVWVEAWIDEEDLASVRLGTEAKVSLQPWPDREFTGVVERVGIATDLELPDSEVPQPRFTRMRGMPVVAVRIRLVDPPSPLLPGLSAVVAIDKPAGLD